MTCVWIEGAAFLAAHAKTTNSARAFGLLFTASMSNQQPQARVPIRIPLPGLVSPPAQDGAVPQISQDPRTKQKAQILFVEIAVFAWENAMYGIGALLTLFGAFSFRGRLGRPLHLAAGVIILLSTLATIATMALLTNPERGGMEPLSMWNYLVVGIIQSAYGMVLLVVFRRCRRDSCSERSFVAQ